MQPLNHSLWRIQTQSAQPPRQAPPAQRKPRRRWRLRLFLASSLALIACLAGLLIYGLLLFRSATNVLVLGIDRRPNEGYTVRTDTMLLVRADPSNRQLVLLSIPRDLWVTIPGRGEERINAAHVYGELEAPGQGPARAAETVSLNFEIPVPHTLRLDFDAFRSVIDAAGGIEIDVPATIVDNAYPTDDYGTTRIEIQAGLQHMDGETALRYARTRHASNDFERAARQQQVFVALARKLSSPTGWLRVPQVLQAFQSVVDTDLSIHDLLRLLLAWQRAGGDSIAKIVIDQTMTTSFRTAQGAQVLLPRWELILPLVQAQFAP